MINLGISSARQKAFHQALASDHQIKITVALLDLSHKHVADVSEYFIDGQVNLDAYAPVKRSATVSLMDPSHGLGLDSTNPTDGQAFLDRMVEIIYSVWVEDDWVDVPVFVGPINKVERNAEVVEIEAMGKETFAKTPQGISKTYRKGVTRIWVIKSLLRDLTGESKFIFPNWWHRTAETLTVAPTHSAWYHAWNMAKAMNASLFYNGRGQMVLKRRSTRTIWTFKDGEGGTVLTRPEATYSTDDVVNMVHITGGVPKGAKKKVEATAKLPKSHPLSSHNLGRNGVDRNIIERIEDDTLKSTRAARNAAQRRIKEIMVEDAEVTFDSLPIPHLEEFDVVRVNAGGVSMTFRIDKMTIPLSHGGVSSIGYLKKVSRNVKNIRRNR